MPSPAPPPELLLARLLLPDSTGAELEYEVAVDSPDSTASASRTRASETCLRWASQRAWASAYCRSHSSRCASKPSSQSLVSGSKPSGYL